MPDLEQSKEAVSNLITQIDKLHDAHGKVACELFISAQALIAPEATLKGDAHLAREEHRVIIQKIDTKKHKWQTFE